LSQNKEALRNTALYDELWAEVQELKEVIQKGKSPPAVHSIIHNVALRSLNMLDESQPVWIIIDRLDQCHGDGTINSDRKSVLKILLRLVESEELKVKIRVLIVVNGVDWKVKEQEDELGSEKDGSITISELHQAARL
jgi:hypothetical protein